jgi:hypothetical protein
LSFAFYERLTRHQQRVCRRSDGVAHVVLPRVSDLRPATGTLHLDYELLGLADSFHTFHAEGFSQRQSSLVRKLLPPVPDRTARPDA